LHRRRLLSVGLSAATAPFLKGSRASAAPPASGPTDAEALAEFSAYARAIYPVQRPARAAPPPPQTDFQVRRDRPKQLILGLGFEIQSDGIASGNAGLDDSETGAPHDLVPEERERLYREMLRGFRFCRLAGGLYLRGTDEAKRQLRPRWPTQFTELHEMFARAGIDGASFEYWSPLPYWKANAQLAGTVSPMKGRDPLNVLRCFGPAFDQDPIYRGDRKRFLADFAAACRQDLVTLRDAGVPVRFWNLQNEPIVSSLYSSCTYSYADYVEAFLAVAPQIKGLDPRISVIADTSLDYEFRHIKPVLDNPAPAGLVDALAIHRIGVDSMEVVRRRGPAGKPIINNEFEYLGGPASPARCLNTVQSIMNWFQRADSPTWFWLHALKPYLNAEASGYSLGFWRPQSQSAPSRDAAFPGMRPGHWVWNTYNWNAVGGFVRRLPWNSRSLSVDEATADDDLRIMAFARPDGRLVVVVSNRCGAPHTFRIATDSGRRFRGFRYTPDDAGRDCLGVAIGTKSAPELSVTVPDAAWEFWEEI